MKASANNDCLSGLIRIATKPSGKSTTLAILNTMSCTKEGRATRFRDRKGGPLGAQGAYKTTGGYTARAHTSFHPKKFTFDPPDALRS